MPVPSLDCMVYCICYLALFGQECPAQWSSAEWKRGECGISDTPKRICLSSDTVNIPEANDGHHLSIVQFDTFFHVGGYCDFESLTCCHAE